MRSAFFLFGLISASYLPAQQTSFSGPVQAVTFDAPTRSLREVIGVPGAASFGPALLQNVDLGSVAPLQNYAIVFESNKCLLVSGLGSNTISSAAIAGVSEYPDGIAWSGDGSVAVLYSLAGGWFQTISGLPTAPAAGTLVDVSSLGGSLSAIAVDGPGKQIAIGVSGQTGGVYQAEGGQFVPVASMAKPMSLSFSSDGQTLYALDGATLQVTAQSLSGQGFQTLALPGIANPIAIQAAEDSQNHQVLYIAGGSDRLLRILDIATQQPTDIPLKFQPTTVGVFGSGSFLLAARAQSVNPLWLFATAPQPNAFFVPAIRLLLPDHGTVLATGRTR